MSIASEITRLQGAKNTLKTKLNAKNDAQHQITDETIDEYGDFVDSISSGGGDTSDATALQSDILSGKTAYIATGKATGSMANNGALSYTPGDNALTIPAGYTSGGTISAVDITQLNDYAECLNIANKILYQTVNDFIQSTGTQYINTGINSGYDARFSYDIKFKLNQVIDGASILGLNKRMSSLSTYDGYLRVNDKPIIPSDIAIHELKYNRSTGAVVLDGNSYTITTSITDSESGDIHIFRRSGAANSYAKMNLYYVKIYSMDKSTLYRDMIPAKVNGVYCLYDKVSGNYFYNAGTGSFSGEV